MGDSGEVDRCGRLCIGGGSDVDEAGGVFESGADCGRVVIDGGEVGLDFGAGGAVDAKRTRKGRHQAPADIALRADDDEAF
jgi:hypothetical protein